VPGGTELPNRAGQPRLLVDSLIARCVDVFWNALRHLVMAAVALSLGALATITRFTRSGVPETLQKGLCPLREGRSAIHAGG
jgi:ABC-type dipeptide/oligopeptide/nickel transport system permease component